MKYQLVSRAVFDQPWAILPGKLEAMVELLQLRIEGDRLTDDEIEARISAASGPKLRRVRGGVAVLPLQGVIAQKMDLFIRASGGTSTERFAQELDEAVADKSISAIVLDVDSPGGSVYGVSELADRIFAARSRKRIYAVSNSLMASAAYWLGSQAEKLFVTPGGEAGSIGVIAAHTDWSKAEESAGIKTTIIKAGKFKGEGNPHEPLADESRAAMQKRVDEYYSMFVKAVARGRETTPKAVQDGYGEGRVVGAKEAVSLGMADGVKTMEAVLAELTGQAERASAGAALAAELV